MECTCGLILTTGLVRNFSLFLKFYEEGISAIIGKHKDLFSVKISQMLFNWEW